MPLVYQATNLINGKRYIGWTGLDLALRRARHIHASNGDRKRHAPFHYALRKYGAEMFRFSILLIVADKPSALVEEVRLIALLRPEYNATKGGEGILGYRHSEETLEKLRGRKHSEKTLEKMRAAGRAQLESWLARRHIGPEASARSVRCIEDGLVFPSASEASRHYSLPKSAIIEVCNGHHRNRLTVGGRRFSYVVLQDREIEALDQKAASRRRNKLSPSDVAEIRILFDTVTVPEIADRYGVSKYTIYDIRNGRGWKNGRPA
jgi:group I intron endonuclease